MANQTFNSLKLGFTNCYLLKCRDGYLLIDTSYPKHFPAFQKAVAKLGIEIGEIRYLLLTHHHDDHAGFAAALIEETRCRVIAHREAVAPLEQGRPEDTIKPVTRRVKLVFRLFSLFHRDFTFAPISFEEEDLVLTDDDAGFLKRIGLDGTILHTPGHSRDSISLVLSDGSAFVGDAAMNFLRFTGVGCHPIFVEDLDMVYQSWHKLRIAGARTVYPAHGKPFLAKELVRRL